MQSKRDDTVYLSSQINEIFATTEVTQYFTNELENPIELRILFPIIKKLSLSKFVVTIDDKVIVSKVMPKEKAEEKYNDSLASGNVGFISRYEEDNKAYSVNIGNLQPKKRIELRSIFIQMIDSNDLSYQYEIMENYPSFQSKELNIKNSENKKINAIFKIETQSKITRLIAPFLDEKLKVYCVYKVKYSQDYKIAEIEYQNDKINLNNKTEDNKSFSILFRTENMNKPIIYSQYNPEKNETAYSINYTYISKNLKEIPIAEKPDEDNTISYIAKYEDNIINETPGLFIFLIDQSGSMWGKSIELVKKALLLFIQSLPKESYFQLIGFGSEYKKYNDQPVIYNKDNIEKIINVIKGLDADLGGTDISKPLREIFNSDDVYSKINMSKSIFMLTDGYVDDRNDCINLIKNNANKFRIHSIGIGNRFDEKLIEQCGKLGKGSSSFVKDVENINSVVIGILNKGLRPYITNINFEFENYKDEIASSIISCNPTNNFAYQNELMNYSFILSGNKELTDLKIKLTGKDPINQIEEKNCFEKIIKLENGEEMSKMIVGKALKYNEELIKDEKKEISFAKKYQILSKNTALFAEILNDEKQESKLIKVDLAKINAKLESSNNPNFSIGNNYNSPPFNSPNIMLNLNQNNQINFTGGMRNMNSFGPIGLHSIPPTTNMGMNMQLMGNMNPMGFNPMMHQMMMQQQAMGLQGMMQQYQMPMPMIGMPPQGMMQQQNQMQMAMMQQQHQMQMAMMQQQNQMQMAMGSPPIMNCMSSSPKNQQANSINIINNNINQKVIGSKKSEFSDLNLIMNQDALEGFWDENEETKKIIDIISLDKFNKIKDKITALNKGGKEKKIIYTILVIYYLKTNLSQKLNEYRLVIHKAEKFLKENGIDYNDIVSDIN